MSISNGVLSDEFGVFTSVADMIFLLKYENVYHIYRKRQSLESFAWLTWHREVDFDTNLSTPILYTANSINPLAGPINNSHPFLDRSLSIEYCYADTK